MLGVTLCPLAADPDTGEITPILTIVTDNSRTVPLVPVPGLHRHPPRTAPRAHPAEVTWPERLGATADSAP